MFARKVKGMESWLWRGFLALGLERPGTLLPVVRKGFRKSIRQEIKLIVHFQCQSNDWSLPSEVTRREGEILNLHSEFLASVLSLTLYDSRCVLSSFCAFITMKHILTEVTLIFLNTFNQYTLNKYLIIYKILSIPGSNFDLFNHSRTISFQLSSI